MRNSVIPAILFSILCVANGAQAAECLGKDARYSMVDAEGFELVFTRAKEPRSWSDLAATVKTPTRSLEFSLTASNGYSFNYLVLEEPQQKLAESASDDEGSFRLYGFDAQMNAVNLPQGEQSAPAFVFMPELGSYLWYGQEPREFLPVGMWRLVPCP